MPKVEKVVVPVWEPVTYERVGVGSSGPRFIVRGGLKSKTVYRVVVPERV